MTIINRTYVIIYNLEKLSKLALTAFFLFFIFLFFFFFSLRYKDDKFLNSIFRVEM